jgi:hypothetical protein
MNAFWKGFASCFDIFGLLAEPIDLPKTDEEAFERDRLALQQDWEAVYGQAVFLDPPVAQSEDKHELDRS